MNQAWSIVKAIIVSVGGIGAIITAVVYFSSNFIAERLQKKYELKINEKFEKYKADIDNKKYVTKTKFDAEFELYKNLSKNFFDLVKCISVLIPQGLVSVPADAGKREELDKKHYTAAYTALIAAQDQLNSNAAFIPEKFYNAYEEIRQLCNMQLSDFEERWNVGAFIPQGEKASLPYETYKRTGEINDKFKQLNSELREYLSKLDVIE